MLRAQSVVWHFVRHPVYGKFLIGYWVHLWKVMDSNVNGTLPLCGVYYDPEGSGVRVCTRNAYFYTYTKKLMQKT